MCGCVGVWLRVCILKLSKIISKNQKNQKIPKNVMLMKIKIIISIKICNYKNQLQIAIIIILNYNNCNSFIFQEFKNFIRLKKTFQNC